MGCTSSKNEKGHSAQALAELHRPRDSVSRSPAAVPAPAAARESSQSKAVAALKIQRLVRQSSQKKNAMEASAWKIFTEVDALDEAETLLVSNFITDVLGSEEFKGEGLRADDATARASQRLDLHSISLSFDEEDNPLGSGDVGHYDLPGKTPMAEVAWRVHEVYRRGGLLAEHLIYRIVRSVFQMAKTLPNVTNIRFGQSEKLTIVGDLHGQLDDLLYILDNSGWPSAGNKYLFNGDLVDRGEKSIEVVTLVYALYAAFPNDVFVNRGNHEDKGVCTFYGFIDECKMKYDLTLFEMFCESFKQLPLCSVINDAVFVVHGGLFHTHTVTLADLSRIDRLDYVAERMNPHSERAKADPKGFYLRTLQQCALWSDPVLSDKVLCNNSRGSGVLFGPSITMSFLKNNGLQMVVRSHECMQDGIGWPFEGTALARKLCTVFSASNYAESGNTAAFMVLYNHMVPGAEPIQGSQMFYLTPHFSTASETCSSLIREGSERMLNNMIANKWNALRLNFAAAGVKGCGLIPATKWAEVMRDVTKLKVLFLPLLHIIAPPDALQGSMVNYAAFLKKYEVGTSGKQVEMHEIYAQKRELEVIFKFFDVDGDGTITAEEFRKGFECLNKNRPPEKQLQNPDDVLRIMDFDNNKSVDMNEFFEAFRLLGTV